MARRFETDAIRAGYDPESTYGALLPPIYQTTTYLQAGPNETKGYSYSRSGNPTVTFLEKRLGALEGAKQPALCFATGMAALTCLGTALLKQGEKVVIGDAVYGGTVRLYNNTFEKFGVQVQYVDTSDLAATKKAITKGTRLVILETPANPTLKVTDIRAVCDVARAQGALVAVDNTFLTAYYQRPLALGADLVVYSTTKYIEGHNATTGGAIVTNDAKLYERIKFDQNALGIILSPFEAWLTLQGLKTLPLRLERHSKNAQAVAEWLERDPRVARVNYPGLKRFAGHAASVKQATGHAGMLSFELKAGFETAKRLMQSVRLVSLAENLGAVESIITHPASMTHASMPADLRAKAGITDGLVRISVGLEHIDDLLADLGQAFDAAHAGANNRRKAVAATA
ncbi:MAG: PLP-dependent transferase [Euryarchaeota archaeon]|nr:PLP-dependent transferase [Euryarchaeota archaeon]